ncbi:cytochrome P450 4c21-like [Uranotaenia lowii]|uniref:cytochrome P450 4c21-like n=1 Tax=Uranotaenia lowii TaxID=190385 RepID=UPI00247ABA4D|nr:cytochrome P450 4c21-like [Uranotaenia lowii]
MLLLFGVIFLLLFLLDYIRKNYYYRFSRSIPSIPGSYPILGNALLLLGKSEQQRFENFKFVFSHTKRLSKTWLGPQLVVCVAHPDLVQKILKEPSCCEKPFFYDFINLEHGLFAAKYKVWKPYRKVLNPTFNTKVLHSFIPIFQKCSQKMVLRMGLGQSARQMPVDVLEFALECTLEMVCATTLGTDVFRREGKDNFLRCLRKLFGLLATRVLSAEIYSDVIYRLTRGYREEQRCRRVCHDFTYKIIQERKITLANNPPTKDSEDGFETRTPRIFIDQVLSMGDDEAKLSDQILFEQILTIIAAGYDTTAQMIAHTCLFLAMLPEVQEKLHKEIVTKIPNENDQSDPEILKSLPYLEKVIRESLRLAPVGPIIARVNLADIELDEHKIPKGNLFVFNFYDLHRRPDIWGPNADQFDPENFTPERIQQRHPFGYLPFSGGSRNCIGERYAMFSTKLMLIAIVRNFQLSTDIEYSDLKYLLDITLNLAFKHMIRLNPRAHRME